MTTRPAGLPRCLSSCPAPRPSLDVDDRTDRKPSLVPKREISRTIPEGYAELLAAAKDRVRRAHISAARRVNSELVLMYLALGQLILEPSGRRGPGNKGAGTPRRGPPIRVSRAARLLSPQPALLPPSRLDLRRPRSAASCCTIALGPRHGPCRQARRRRAEALVRRPGRRARLVPQRPRAPHRHPAAHPRRPLTRPRSDPRRSDRLRPRARPGQGPLPPGLPRARRRPLRTPWPTG